MESCINKSKLRLCQLEIVFKDSLNILENLSNKTKKEDALNPFRQEAYHLINGCVNRAFKKVLTEENFLNQFILKKIDLLSTKKVNQEADDE